MTTFLIWEDNLDSYNELSVETSGIAQMSRMINT